MLANAIARPVALSCGACRRRSSAPLSQRSWRAPAASGTASRHAIVHRVTGHAGNSLRRTAARAATAAAAEEQAAESELQAFLRWCIANGVEGIGAAGSKAALYQGEGGERGVVCVQPIEAGEVVLRIPTRLAITDLVEEEEQEEGEGEQGASAGAAAEWERAWSLRLAGKLLALAGQGSACPWWPYLQALPRSVPSPLTAFSWEDVEAIEYQPMRRQLEHATWLAASASQQPGGSRHSREAWDWALSVVHSRTFGTPGAGGGVGVRMLVPLVDMLNHAGDYVTSPPGGSAAPEVQAFDNVRWELRAPAGPGGDWAMEVAATRAIQPGEELLLSYGERENSDFFLHYGFVPPRNPHDRVALFTDIESAIDWWLDAFVPLGALPPARLTAAINAAYKAAEEQDSAGLAAEAVLAAVPEAEAEVIRAELATVKLSAGGMVDERLVAAVRALYETVAASAGDLQASSSGGSGGGSALASSLGGSWGQHLRLAVARRCREILAGMPTPLAEDLRQLAAWEQQTGQAQHSWAAAQQRYGPAIAVYEARHGPLHAAAAAAAAPAGAGSEQAGSSSGCNSGDGSAGGLLDAGAAAGPDAALAQLLLQQAKQPQPQPQAAGAGAAAEAAPAGSSSGSILPVIYRAYKKLIAWDALLAAED